MIVREKSGTIGRCTVVAEVIIYSGWDRCNFAAGRAYCGAGRRMRYTDVTPVLY